MKVENGKILNYFVVGHEMKNGKYAISFPDFPNLGAIVEKQEEAPEVAIKLLSEKAEQGLSLPIPKPESEIKEELEEASFHFALEVNQADSLPFEEEVCDIESKSQVDHFTEERERQEAEMKSRLRYCCKNSCKENQKS